MKENFTQEENNIIAKLESYAKQLDSNIDTSEEMDFNEFFSFLKYVKTLNIDERILSYSNYLYGAALPMYDQSLTQTDYTDEPELDVITKATCWLDVINKSTVVDFNELDERLGKGISDKLKAYADNSNELWVLIMGYKHYWYIKKHRLETGDKSTYPINKFL